MSQILKSTTRWGVCLATATALALVLGVAQREGVSAQTQARQAGGPREGIKVRGHWTIDVRRPDGTLVTHREFDNHYEGATLLPKLIGGEAVVGRWAIQLAGRRLVGFPFTDFDSPCGVPALRQPCLIVEEGEQPLAGTSSPNLTVTRSDTGLVLSGTATSQHANSKIVTVRTLVQVCANPDLSPAACRATTTPKFIFTGTDIDEIPVALGQLVQVTVTISFS